MPSGASRTAMLGRIDRICVRGTVAANSNMTFRQHMVYFRSVQEWVHPLTLHLTGQQPLRAARGPHLVSEGFQSNSRLAVLNINIRRVGAMTS